MDLDALDWALAAGEIAAAGIDTHAQEPVGADYPLMKYSDNIILTPHLAGWAMGGLTRIADIAAGNTISALTGTVPQYTCNPDAVALWKERFGF